MRARRGAAALRLERDVDHHDRVLLHDPTSMIMPTKP
jgi:hypothetical protein